MKATFIENMGDGKINMEIKGTTVNETIKKGRGTAYEIQTTSSCYRRVKLIIKGEKFN